MDHPQLLSWLQLAQTSSNRFLPVVACDLKGNSVAYGATSALDFNKRCCVRHLSGLKLSFNIAHPRSKLLCTEVRETFRNQTLYV